MRLQRKKIVCSPKKAKKEKKNQKDKMTLTSRLMISLDNDEAPPALCLLQSFTIMQLSDGTTEQGIVRFPEVQVLN